MQDLKPYYKCDICQEWLSVDEQILIGHLRKHIDNRRDWFGLIRRIYEAEFPSYK